MTFQEIRYATAAGVATITLSRPDKLNAWTSTMEAEVRQAMQAAENDSDVRVILLTGAGRGFCAGADMSILSSTAAHGVTAEVRERAINRDGGVRAGRVDFQQRYSYFPAIPKPVIAAVNGPAVGLGFVISLFCDLRIAAASARFGTAFSRRGLIAEYGMAWVLPRLVGLGNALDLLFTARLIDSSEALRMGLVNRVLPDEGFHEQSGAFAADLAASVSPRSLRVMKQQLYNAQFQTLAEATEEAETEMLASLNCDDFKEGVAHFVEKRAPRFTGR